MHKGLKVIFLAIIVLSVFFCGCKQGCKDPKALNFDPSAKTENATCLYCDSVTTSSSIPVPGIDNSQSGEPTVANLVFTQSSFSNFGNGCVSVNKQTGSNCTVYLNIVNLTPTHMSGEFSISFESGFGQVGWTHTQTISSATPIAPNDTLKVGIINHNCDSIAAGSFFVQLFNMQYQ